MRSKFCWPNGNGMETTGSEAKDKRRNENKKRRKKSRWGSSYTSTTTHRTHRSDDPIETEWKCVTSCSPRSDKGSSRPFSYFIVQPSLIDIRCSKLQQLRPDGWIIMATIRYSHPVMVTAFVLLTFIVSKSSILRGVTAEFYIGEYQTFADHSARNKVKETNPVFHQYNNNNNNMNDDSGGGIDDDDDDDEESNELIGKSQSEKQSRRRHHHQHRQGSVGRGFSTFNPLTPGGTIYLAFIFLIPLTVGKTGLGRSKSYSKTNGLLERLIHKVQQDQQSLYSEMGYVDGNLMFRRAWRDIRDSLAKKLLWLPWRRRLRDIVTSNRNNGTNNPNRKRKKKKYYKS